MQINSLFESIISAKNQKPIDRAYTVHTKSHVLYIFKLLLLVSKGMLKKITS